MKTKQFIAMAIIANLNRAALAAMVPLLIIALALIGCKKEEPDPCTCNPKDHLQAGETCTCGGEGCNCTVEPKVRTAERIDFGTNLYTMVSSTKALTDEQWTTAKTKLTTALDTASKKEEPLITNCATLFDGKMGINIKLEEPQGYSYYKIDADTLFILFNADYVISATAADLLTKVIAAVNSGVTGDTMQQ